jgi:hypothetical protein
VNAPDRGGRARLGLFLVIFAVVFGVAGLVIPVPGSFTTPTADRRDPEMILGGPLPRCLELAYDREDVGMLPDRVQLLADPAPEYARPSNGGVAYRASEGARPEWMYGAWWAATPDSIDLQGYHTRRIRLSLRGDTLTGRAGWTHHGSLFLAMIAGLTDGDLVVHAIPAPCMSSAEPPAT